MHKMEYSEVSEEDILKLIIRNIHLLDDMRGEWSEPYLLISVAKDNLNSSM